MKIISGKVERAQKVIIYGPEGIGKSTFAASFPAPLFIDVEGSTSQLDVDRTEKPLSWTSLTSLVDSISTNNLGYKTLVIDTIDWAERLANQHVCAKFNKEGIEDFGYGKGYVHLAEEVGRFLNKLTDLVEKGINVVLCAHSLIKKFERPDESGAYDRWELKLEKKTAPLVKEWSDMLLFANYKTLVVEINGKKKAQGGQRIIHTQHHPCWDAKNRHGLPEELEMAYSAIKDHVFDISSSPKPKTDPDPESKTESKTDLKSEPKSEDRTESDSNAAVNSKLYQLMEQNDVSVEEIQDAVVDRGYYPKDTKMEIYTEEFIEGVLISAWPQVLELIKSKRKEKVAA